MAIRASENPESQPASTAESVAESTELNNLLTAESTEEDSGEWLVIASGSHEGRNTTVLKVNKIHKDIDNILMNHGIDATGSDKNGMKILPPIFHDVALNSQAENLGDHSMLEQHVNGSNTFNIEEEAITPCYPIYATSSGEIHPQFEESGDESGDISFLANDRREKFFETWYTHFGERHTLLADILDPSGKYYQECRQANESHKFT